MSATVRPASSHLRAVPAGRCLRSMSRNRVRSRRALLAGALGGLGVWAASAIGRVAPAEAEAGDPIRMGRLNKASSIL